MTKNKENLVRADRAPTNGEIELAVERLSPELGPRCPSAAHWRHKLHSSEPGARPLARGGPGDQTFASSAWCMKDAAHFRAHAKRIERRRRSVGGALTLHTTHLETAKALLLAANPESTFLVHWMAHGVKQHTRPIQI